MGIIRWPKKPHFTTCSKYSTSTNSKTYSATLLLPKTGFPLRADPSIREEPFRQRTSEDLYKWQWHNLRGPLFVLHDGPPYANGSLHMGHALNKILKDIINRFHVLSGRRVHYIPGWDCHGLPIENKALKDMRANHRTLPPSKIRETARQTAEREISIQKAEFRQLGIMADWDTPQRTYRTMDHRYEMQQLLVFKKLVEKGLIYRQYRPVYYSPSSRSALAEAELIYVDNHVSNAVYVSYECVFETFSPLLRAALLPHVASNKVNLLIWTTTPWTLPANMAIAINSKMEYAIVKCVSSESLFLVGKDLLPALQTVLGPDITTVHTCQGSELLSLRYRAHFHKSESQFNEFPVVHSSHVTSTSGTGLVHCAPAHGIEDYQTYLDNTVIIKQPEDKALVCLVGPDGTFSDQAVAEASWLDSDYGAQLVGKPVLKEGSSQVIEILKSTGSLVSEQKYCHRYPYDWKTNTPIIVTATSQWFADLSLIKSKALEALNSVQFVPEISRTRLESFVRDRSEWCISRQRPWGVPIPVLLNETANEAILSAESLEFIISVLDKNGIEHWWNGPVDDFISPQLKAAYPSAIWKRGNDTMDVWFDSGTAWTLLQDLISLRIEDRNAGNQFFADVCLEGSDQHRGWFQSLLLTSIGSSNNLNEALDNAEPSMVPYKYLITHGFVLDKDGKKMSKSLGNVISPMTVVAGGKDPKAQPPYGADVLRLWAATIDYTRDTLLSPTVLQQTAESLRKIRNSARFLLGNLSRGFDVGTKPRDLSLVDRYIMYELYHLERTSKKAYQEFRFSQVAVSLDRFAKITLSSLYLDITKDILYADAPESPSRQRVLWVMNEVLQTMTAVMAPILPHLSEEIYHHETSRNGNGWKDTKPTGVSVFAEGWRSIDESWNNKTIAQEMGVLLHIRDTVLALLERARADKLIRNSLEASVDIIIPNGLVDLDNSIQLMLDQESLLRTLFIVSDAQIVDEGSLGTKSFEWSISEVPDISDLDTSVTIRVRPSEKNKCPRCWTYTRDEHEEVCERCSKVLQFTKSINRIGLL